MHTLVDTHCHLDSSSFDEDRIDVLLRAKEANITCQIVPGTTYKSCVNILDLCEIHNNMYAAIGIHPNNENISINQVMSLEKLLNHERVVAIGEIGLDYYRNTSEKHTQWEVFTAQLELAKRYNLPVIIHCRDAIDDILNILITWQNDLLESSKELAKNPGVLHSFSSDLIHAEQAVENKFYIGISGMITYKNNLKLHEITRKVPIESILLETDSPFLTPHPFRGKRNEPAYLRYIADRVAELRNVSTKEVSIKTNANANRVFKIEN